jgi:hypothetical protein
MNARKAEQRQNEQDQMRKQEFNLQQEARQFDLANAKANADNSRVDRERALALQARGDAFNKHFNSAYTLAQSGDEQGAITTLANGFNDPAFGMPYRAIPQTGPDGKMVKDKNGKYVIGYADPSGKLVTTQSWTLQDALSGFRGINDAASQYDNLRKSQEKASEKAADRAHDMAKIDRTGEWTVKRVATSADAAMERALLRHGGDGNDGSGKKSKYSLEDEIKGIFGADADVSPLNRKMLVQQIDSGIGAASSGKDAKSRAEGWNQAYRGFLGAVTSADTRRELSPSQIENQAKIMFDKHLRETYGVGYDDAMAKLGLVDPKTLPKKGRAQQPAQAGNPPNTPAKTLVDPARQARDAQKAYQNANNFITGGGF